MSLSVTPTATPPLPPPRPPWGPTPSCSGWASSRRRRRPRFSSSSPWTARRRRPPPAPPPSPGWSGPPPTGPAPPSATWGSPAGSYFEVPDTTRYIFFLLLLSFPALEFEKIKKKKKNDWSDAGGGSELPLTHAFHPSIFPSSLFKLRLSGILFKGRKRNVRTQQSCQLWAQVKFCQRNMPDIGTYKIILFAVAPKCVFSVLFKNVLTRTWEKIRGLFSKKKYGQTCKNAFVQYCFPINFKIK